MENTNEHSQMNKSNYGRFIAMLGLSLVAMYIKMYLNTYELAHVTYSETRTYMALVMGAAMAIVMLLYMLHMYKSKKANIAIFAGSALVFALALWLVRSQKTVEDVSYMRAMIPHHSIAIMTSERANISDPRVRELADQIIKSQREEIAEMNWKAAGKLKKACRLGTLRKLLSARTLLMLRVVSPVFFGGHNLF